MLPIYTRYLSPSDYGIIAYTHSIVLFLYILGSLALNTYVLRYYFVHSDENGRRVLVGTSHITIIAFNLVIMVLCMIIFPNIIDKFNIQVPWNPFFRLAIIINFLDGVSIIPLVLYRVRQDAITFMLLGVTRTLFVVAFTIYFVIFKGEGVLGTFNAQLYVYLFYSILYSYVIYKCACYKFSFRYLKEGLSFSLPLLPGYICYFLMSLSDRLILERSVSISEIGIYNVASSLSMALNIIVQSGYKAIEPEMFKRYGTTSYVEFAETTKRLFFGVIYVAAFALSLFSQEIFHIMTSRSFHMGYFLIPILVISPIMIGQNTFFGLILAGEKRTKVQGFASILSGLLCISLNLILIPIGGIYAAAISSAISFLFMSLFLYSRIHMIKKSICRELILVLIMPLLSYGVFFSLKEISFQGVLLKLLLIMFYLYLAIVMLGMKELLLSRNCVKRYLNSKKVWK